jgi:hypothetical protein
MGTLDVLPFPRPLSLRPDTELGRSDSVVFKCINFSDVNIENFFEILGIQLSADIIFMAYSFFRGTVRRQKRDSVVFKYISDMNIEKILEILRNNTILCIYVMHYRHSIIKCPSILFRPCIHYTLSLTV